MGLEDVPRCQHVKINGTQCGSPALRSRRHCFFHDKVRREQARIAANASAPRRFDLPLLEDANSVQVALMKIIQALGSGQIDHKTAGLMLYALQTASINLRYTEFEASDVTDIVIDRDTVNATCINGPQWFEDDFEAETENDELENEEEIEGEAENQAENQAQGEAENEGSVAALQANAQTKTEAGAKQSSKKEMPAKNEKKAASTAEVRKQVQALARNWLSETLSQKPQ